MSLATESRLGSRASSVHSVSSRSSEDTRPIGGSSKDDSAQPSRQAPSVDGYESDSSVDQLPTDAVSLALQEHVIQEFLSANVLQDLADLAEHFASFIEAYALSGRPVALAVSRAYRVLQAYMGNLVLAGMLIL